MNMNFHSDLASYIKNNDLRGANRTLMFELGKALALNKSDFVELLKNSGIEASEFESETSLIEKFVNNAPSNRKLILSAAFLINSRNKSVSFAGDDDEVSDVGVKASYKVMFNHFDAQQFEDESQSDDFYSASGAVQAIAGAVGKGAELGQRISENQRLKKYGATDTLAKQQEARQQLIQSVLEQKQLQIKAKEKQQEQKSKTTRTVLIVGGIVVAVGLIAVAMYVMKKRK